MSLEQPPAPSGLQENAYLPSGPEPLISEEFAGLNTNTTRAGVDDKQLWWIDGFMPLDRRNLRTLYGIGSAIYTRPDSTTIVCYGFFNIGTTPYCVVFLNNGRVDVVNTGTLAVTTLLTAGSITSPAIQNVGITQWGRQYLIIVANQTNGYWIWDGTFLYQPGTLGPQIGLTGVGSGYTSVPVVSILGGHGVGAIAVATIANGIVTTVSLTNPGSGYLATDSASVVFSGGQSSGSGGSINAFVTAGTLSSVSIVAGGSNYAFGTSTSLTFSGHGSSPFGAVAVFETNGTITAASITNVGGNYSSPPTVVILPGPTVNASATISLMPLGIQGTAAETYQGHVWVASGPSISFTAPGSVNDFATSDGGGNFISSDSFLRQSYTQLLQSNGFLYLVADSSINYISGVTTSGSPPTTQFTNQNADPQIGTPYASTAGVFGRNIVFANSFGVHMLYGAAVSKIGDELNGVWPTASTLGSFQVSAATAVIFDRRVRILLVPIIDPVTGTQVNKLLMWDGKRWFASNQDVGLIYIASQEINSVITAYGTDGTSIYPLFTTPSSFQKVIQSRLWDAPGGQLFEKTATRWWGLFTYASTVTSNLKLSIDNENNSSPTWTNNGTLYTITGPTSLGYFTSPPQAVGQSGVLTGWTIFTNAQDVAVVQFTMRDEVAGYRG
jgi:hypothetical protein